MGGITAYLRGVVESMEGGSWDELADRLRLVGEWEFEGYVEAPADAPRWTAGL
jgi:hypothetical protein